MQLVALYSTRCLENENGCLKCISLIKPKILICYMPYFEALWYPHPLGHPRGEFFNVQISSSRGFLGTLNTMVILLKVYFNVGGHFTLRAK